MGTLEIVRTLAYGILVPTMFMAGFIIQYRNFPLAVFFGLQGIVYLIHLFIVVFTPGQSGVTGNPAEFLYTVVIVVQAVAASAVIYREYRIRRALHRIIKTYSQDIQEDTQMPKFQIPGVLPVALILLLPPAITPVIQQFFPTNTYWWSALLVVIMNVIVIVVRISWPDESAKVPMPMSQEAPDGVLQQPPPKPSKALQVLFGA